TEDRHAADAEVGSRLPPNKVSLGRVMKHWVCPAPGFEGALRTHRCRRREGLLQRPEEVLRQEDLLVAVLVDVPESEGLIHHLREHTTLIRSVDVAIIVVDDRTDPDPGRTHEVNVSCLERCQHLGQDRCGILLDEEEASLVELNDVVEAVEVKVEPALNIVGPVGLSLDRESVWGEGAEEYLVEPKTYILVYNLMDPSKASFGRRHERTDAVPAESGTSLMDTSYRPLVAVPTWAGPVPVVKVPRPIQGRRDQHVVRLAEREDILTDQREVGGNHEPECATVAPVQLFRAHDDTLDEREVQQRLSALELDLDGR